MSRSYPEGNFGGNQLLDHSISLSPLCAYLDIDLHVRTSSALQRPFGRLQLRTRKGRGLSGPSEIALTHIFQYNVQSGRWCQPSPGGAAFPPQTASAALHFRSALGFSPPKHSQSRKSPWSVFQDGRVEPISSASLVSMVGQSRADAATYVPSALHAVQRAARRGTQGPPLRALTSRACDLHRLEAVFAPGCKFSPACAEAPRRATFLGPFSCSSPMDADPRKIALKCRGGLGQARRRRAAQLAAPATAARPSPALLIQHAAM